MEANEGNVPEGTNVDPKVIRGYAALSPEQKVLAKAKQVESMKAKWTDPVYQAKVSQGRASKAIVKLTAEIGNIDVSLASADEATSAALAKTKDTLVVKLAAANAKLVETTAIVDAAKPAVAPTEA